MSDEHVTVDPDADTPPHQQIFEQLRAAIERGALAPRDALPTVRQLAADLGVAPNTVARAYSDLQSDGLVQSDGRRGTRVAEGSRAATARARSQTLHDAAARFIAALRQRGYTRTEIAVVLREVMTER